MLVFSSRAFSFAKTDSLRRLYRVYLVSAGVQVYFYNCDYTTGAGARSVGQQFKVIPLCDQKALLLQL